jgi:hypothetical protein
VLVLDQFEEIFTVGAGDELIEAVLAEVADLAENRPPNAVRQQLDNDPERAAQYDFGKENCKIVIALREDYLADLEGLRRQMPSIMSNVMRLTWMGGQQALEVVLKSGERLVAPGIAERIVGFVAARRDRTTERPPGDIGSHRVNIEPALLSIVCRELNNKRIRAGQPQITGDLLESSSEIVADFYASSLADTDPAVKLFRTGLARGSSRRRSGNTAASVALLQNAGSYWCFPRLYSQVASTLAPLPICLRRPLDGGS